MLLDDNRHAILYHVIIFCYFVDIYIGIDLSTIFSVFYFTTIWTARAGIFCAAMTGIDEALDDTFLSFTLIYPSLSQSLLLWSGYSIFHLFLVSILLGGDTYRPE
jgi:hypothetical protein